ncbi:uncharacterized protein LOC123353147 [Mauremys mutica]|uniref:uncharacterized protein LOC123353147 n=1 Tax=Mauremys mutica TaxID=74926 RepID=UPI001D160E00|nr:uncharacterized protein LOC123353147 [Mauremys mutica]
METSRTRMLLPLPGCRARRTSPHEAASGSPCPHVPCCRRPRSQQLCWRITEPRAGVQRCSLLLGSCSTWLGESSCLPVPARGQFSAYVGYWAKLASFRAVSIRVTPLAQDLPQGSCKQDLAWYLLLLPSPGRHAGQNTLGVAWLERAIRTLCTRAKPQPPQPETGIQGAVLVPSSRRSPSLHPRGRTEPGAVTLWQGTVTNGI